MAIIEKLEKVKVRRETREYKGEIYANYFVPVKVKTFDDRSQKVVELDKQIKMDVPKNDIGMYDVLSMVFMGATEKELFRISSTTTDFNGKKKITYRYEVYSDDDKEIIGVLVPQGESNRALLESVFKNVLSKPDETTDEE